MKATSLVFVLGVASVAPAVARPGDRLPPVIPLPPEFLEIVAEQSLAKVIRRNTNIGDELPDNVFLTGESSSPPQGRRR